MIVIFGIVSALAFVGIGNMVEIKKADISDSVRLELKNHCVRYLSVQSVDHSQVIFDEFVQTNMDGVICPEDGLIVL